jgi:predicted DNA-binding transcriptional regulator AlpA
MPSIPPRLPVTHTLEEALTAQFYAWEQRGRGWQVWKVPVVLEPPFRPFFGHYVTQQPAVDDGRRSTFFGSIAEALRGERSEPSTPQSYVSEDEDDVEPELFVYETPLVEIQIALPPDLKVSRERAAQVLCRLASARDPVAFELIGNAGGVSLQFVCSEADRPQVYQQIQAFFPEAILREESAFLTGRWQDTSSDVALVDFGLSREFMLPLRVSGNFDVDPLIAFVAALANTNADELGVLQIIFTATAHPWSESIMRAVTNEDGRPFFSNFPDMLRQAGQKAGEPLLAAVVRIAARGASEERAWEIARNVGGALTQFAEPAANEFMPLTNDEYPDADHEDDFLARVSRRSGMLLNADELASLVHLPSASVRSPQFVRIARQTRAAPPSCLGAGFLLGENTHAGRTVSVTLPPEARARHMHVIGASGTGKSTLLLRMIMQDIEDGNGLAVLDPHGDLIEQILGRIPAARVPDVVLLDPSDEDYPVGFNILRAHSELEKTLLSSDLVAAFRRLSTSWGDQMTSVLGNAILAFLESSVGGTLADLRRFLIESDFRAQVLTTVRDPQVVYFWRKEFPLLSGRPQASILTRLDTFLRPKLVRNVVCQKENSLDVGRVMNEGKILLVKLAQGAIGEENAHLLGTFLVSKIQQMAMARQEIEESKRRPFYLYVDEFHNFATPSMAAILSGARKYRLGLILAHQEMRQLGRDDEVASAVLSNPHTRICFRLGDGDAKRLADGFASFTAQDLQNLGIGEAICRVERAEDDFNIRTRPLPEVDSESASDRRREVIDASRKAYARSREEVEAALMKDIGENIAGPSATAGVRSERRAPVATSRRNEPPATETEEAFVVGQLPTGRGSPQHKYLQQLIQRWGENRGYRVTIEKPVLDGMGSVDVVLEKTGSPPIACEISVTTTAEHEIGNAQKCLASGYEQVLLIAADKKAQERVKAEVAARLTANQRKRVQVVLPDQIFASIAALEVRTPTADRAAADDKELLTAKEVEELVRIDVKTIYSYVQRGLIPYVRIQSNLRFLRSEVLAWVAEHRSGAKPRGR